MECSTIPITLECVEKWIFTEWDHRFLFPSMSKYLNQIKYMHNVLERSKRFVFCNLMFLRKIANYCIASNMNLHDQRSSYFIKNPFFYSCHFYGKYLYGNINVAGKIKMWPAENGGQIWISIFCHFPNARQIKANHSK